MLFEGWRGTRPQLREEAVRGAGTLPGGGAPQDIWRTIFEITRCSQQQAKGNRDDGGSAPPQTAIEAKAHDDAQDGNGAEDGHHCMGHARGHRLFGVRRAAT